MYIYICSLYIYIYVSVIVFLSYNKQLQVHISFKHLALFHINVIAIAIPDKFLWNVRHQKVHESCTVSMHFPVGVLSTFPG